MWSLQLHKLHSTPARPPWFVLRAPVACCARLCSVEKLDMELLKGQEGWSVLYGPREASHGATEVFVLDVSGHVHEFAEWKKPAGA